jgi:hypothetical protein
MQQGAMTGGASGMPQAAPQTTMQTLANTLRPMQPQTQAPKPQQGRPAPQQHEMVIIMPYLNLLAKKQAQRGMSAPTPDSAPDANKVASTTVTSPDGSTVKATYNKPGMAPMGAAPNPMIGGGLKTYGGSGTANDTTQTTQNIQPQEIPADQAERDQAWRDKKKQEEAAKSGSRIEPKGVFRWIRDRTGWKTIGGETNEEMDVRRGKKEDVENAKAAKEKAEMEARVRELYSYSPNADEIMAKLRPFLDEQRKKAYEQLEQKLGKKQGGVVDAAYIDLEKSLLAYEGNLVANLLSQEVDRQMRVNDALANFEASNYRWHNLSAQDQATLQMQAEILAAQGDYSLKDFLIQTGASFAGKFSGALGTMAALELFADDDTVDNGGDSEPTS